jgi:hypothetical protein
LATKILGNFLGNQIPWIPVWIPYFGYGPLTETPASVPAQAADQGHLGLAETRRIVAKPMSQVYTLAAPVPARLVKPPNKYVFCQIQAMDTAPPVILVPSDSLCFTTRQAAVKLTNARAFLEGFLIEGGGFQRFRFRPPNEIPECVRILTAFRQHLINDRRIVFPDGRQPFPD